MDQRDMQQHFMKELLEERREELKKEAESSDFSVEPKTPTRLTPPRHIFRGIKGSKTFEPQETWKDRKARLKKERKGR